MINFLPIDELTILSRCEEWLRYDGQPVQMRHGFSLYLRPNCEYSRRRYVYRIAEAVEIDFLDQKLKKLKDKTPLEASFFDVGANIGYYSKMMANNYKSATIYSFEPDQITFEILKKKYVI